MEAKELRLNNLFIDSKTNTVISVIGLTEEIITFSGHFKNDWQAEPIPLTEEWLLKFGFEYRLDTGYFGWYSPKIFGESIRIFEVENGWFKYSSAYTVIKNVHQLQNLYFSLTNEELTII